MPLIPFLRKGSTRAQKLKLLRITETSWTETSFNGTDEDAAEDCNYKEKGENQFLVNKVANRGLRMYYFIAMNT